ncbi:fatty-acid--CoA ligase FadD5 [Williamsia sp.]|uniref:fatty-acid--CoA ligase FadD5 n=1 Tax=Williamsia sp. TaxID=1872085 RepID=UPI002F94ECE8
MTSTTLPQSDHLVSEPFRSRRNNWNTHIRRHAEMKPEEVALRFNGQDTSWKQLDERSTAFAAALYRRGVRFGDRVLVLMLNRSEYVEITLGANLIGAIAVPVNIRMTPPEIGFLVADSGATVIVTESLLAPLADAVRTSTPGVDNLIIVGPSDVADALDYETLLAEDPSDLPAIDVPENSIALIMYTSGTTGNPKGAMLSHANMQAQALTCITALQTKVDDIGSCVAPMFHIAALGSMAPLFYMGVRTVIHPLGAFDPESLLDVLEAERITSIFLVPAQWQVVCAAQQAKPRDLSLRVISWGAAPASDTVLHAMSDTFPDAINVAVFGQTEMSPITCVLEGKDALRKLGSVGQVIPAVQARVVDPEMNDVPLGSVGEIVYRGPTMMEGYWQNPQGTADAFAGGWFHSGDLVRMDEEGFVYVVDRKKDMIISGGENIYCAEVENALFAHPKILEAAVVGRADDRWGEVPVAIVVLKPEEQLTFEELIGFLNEHLARFKQPKEMIVIDELPRNASGKVVKPSLRKEYGGKDAGLH